MRVDVALDAYVPADYVGLEAAKMEVHRRIALATHPDQLRDLELELADRFGPVPDPVRNLIGMQELRLAAAPLGQVAVHVGRDGARISGARLTAEEAAALRDRLAGVAVSPSRDEARLPATESASPIDQGRQLADAMIGLRSGALR